MADDEAITGGDAPSSDGVVTVVLRLLRRSLDQGELVGRGEVVATGEAANVRGADDVVRLARAGRDAPA